MENVYIDLGDDMTIGDGDSMVIGEDNLYTESETMVGPQGPPGPPGPAGFSPIATVTQNEGSATITITDATTTSSATVYDGTDGVDGAAASVTVGSTTTGEPGTQASVTNSGSSSAAVLDFVIPKGAKGEQGEQGDAATVDVGTIVSIAPDATPQVTNSGTVHDAILNFAIPQGYDGFSPVATVTQNTGSATITITDELGTTTATVYDGQDGAPGQTGPAGQDGQAATVTVGSTTTGNAGTNASVTNSGTSSAAVLDFVIPRGADGQNGTNGSDGADGFSPIATVTQNTGSATISITDANGTTTATVYDGTPGTVPNDGTLTIQKNGTTVQTFTANQSSNATANITVPTATSELTNDSGFITSVTATDVDWSTFKWHTFNITPGDSSITVKENHCAYNTQIRMCYIHIILRLTSGTKGTLVSGIPQPALGTSQGLSGVGSSGKAFQPWVRAAGNIGCVVDANQTSIDISGCYPISLTSLPTSTGDY